MTMLPLTSRRLFALLALACLGLFGGGLVFSHALHLAACPLCIWQRLLYLVLAALLLLGWRFGAPRLIALLGAVAAAGGVTVAGYQVWLQRFAVDANCAAQQPWWERVADRLGELSPFLFGGSGLCADPAWKFLTLSIADWSLLAFALLFLLLLYDSVRRNRR